MNHVLTEFTMVKGLHESLALAVEARFDKDSSILDLGAGAGAWLERLGNSGYHDLYGVDKDVERFQASKGKFVVADLDYGTIELEGKTFDLITSIEVIEHLENPGQFLHHVAEFLNHDGYLLLTTPNLHSVLCRIRLLLTGNLRQFDTKGEPTHIYPVFLEPLKRLLTLHDLEIIESWTFPKSTSVTSRPSLKLLSSLVTVFLKDDLPGDILCLWIRRKPQSNGS